MTQQPKPLDEASGLPAVENFPHFDRKALGAGIVHLGIGNFHRSHQALYLQEFLQSSSENWMITGVGLLPGDSALVDAMNAQDCLYSLTERSEETNVTKVIGSIKQCLHAPSDPSAVVSALASPDTKIVSLTITEKGYCNTPAGELDFSHPMIEAELPDGAPPVSALGYLLAAAKERMATHASSFTVLSCDNLMNNGDTAKRYLIELASRKDPATAAWIEENVSFPNSMVDRITPRTTAETIAYAQDTIGLDDKCPVASEAFRQWIVEDNFINGRPALEQVGVQFVPDVKPYELLKMRLLNSSHSAMSYVSYLMGHRAVDEAVLDPLIETFLRRYMDEITPTIPPVPGIDVEEYKATLIRRFTNPAIADRIERLAMDGAAKMATCMLPALAELIRDDQPHELVTFAVAGWARYLRGIDEQGNPIEISDPIGGQLTECMRGDDDDITRLLRVREVFGDDLSRNSEFPFRLQSHVSDIEAMGTREALSALLNN